MTHDPHAFEVSARLAELLDAALAGDWAQEQPAMAVLWQTFADPDDLRMAVRRLEHSVEEELTALDDGGAYLAVAHSVVARGAPAAAGRRPDGAPVRVTVATDHASACGLVRHSDGTVEPFAAGDLELTRLLRTLLSLEPAR